MQRNFKRRGFTLIELLATIVLLGCVVVIVIYNMTSVSNTSKEIEYERYVAAIKSAAENYVKNKPEEFKDLYVNRSYVYLTIEDLLRSGNLNEDLINPYTDEKIVYEDKIKAYLSHETGNIILEYPVEKQEEMFLVAIADYVLLGEEYDCMQGAGSYQLSLSDKDGNLILLGNQKIVDKYNFQCSLPSNFDSKQVGTYEVNYTWITESGSKKSATRLLRVLPKD